MKALLRPSVQREIDREEIEAALRRVELKATLWSLPAMENSEVPLALGIGQNFWQLLKKGGNAPPPVKLGARLLYRTADLRRWLTEQPTSDVGATDDNENEHDERQAAPASATSIHATPR